ncbi:MAG: hypothetical protein LBD88_00445 [Candidatus Peribacteria bacterium]|nr:hypothetical protein [Candidatus Peribacteria bacterium]
MNNETFEQVSLKKEALD